MVQDVTHPREKVESAQQKEELDIIAQIIRISVGTPMSSSGPPIKFLSQRTVVCCRKPPSGILNVIAALFRNMHTIKGNARHLRIHLDYQCRARG